MKTKMIFKDSCLGTAAVLFLVLLCIVIAGCSPEDDLPANTEVIYPDDHVEWMSGTRYFPIREVFVNCLPEDLAILTGNSFSYPTFLADDLLDSLNVVFSASNIEFYRSRREFLRVSITYEDNTYLSFDDKNENLFYGEFLTVYYVNITGAASTFASGGYAGMYGGNITLKAKGFAQDPLPIEFSTVIHEFGHCFGLYHTFATQGDGPELVDGSNGSTAGDLVSDTPADCKDIHQSIYGDVATPIPCGKTDANGDDYSPDYTNYMAYYTFADHFTAGQYQRMWDCSFLGSLDMLVKGPAKK